MRETETPVVKFEGVAKTFDGGRSFAVRNLDLDVMEGEFITLLGPSGSGKTTTLMMLAGFEDPSAGEIFVHGRAITSIPPHRRGIGVVFQSYALFPHMTVAENLAFPLKVRGISTAEIDNRVNRAIAMVELTGLERRRPAQLSGGQQQRVALARSFVFEPKLVLMDEPLGALDKRLRDQMQFELKALQRRLGITVVYVTHDQVEAMSMSDRIVMFNGGAVEQLGSPDTIDRRPASLFVARFIGENNAIPGTAAGRKAPDRVVVKLAGGSEIGANAPVQLQAGGSAVLCIRPEAFELSPGKRGYRVEVEETMPLGDQIRLRVRSAELSPRPIIIKIPARGPGRGFSAGDRANLVIDSADAVAFADTGS